MNFLAHAWLARQGTDDFLYGNLIADGVKGVALEPWGESVAAGIRYHRRVDAYVDQHTVVRQAQSRAPAPQRRYAGIALDMLWDHFLACHLEVQQRDALVERCYGVLDSRGAPNRLEAMVPALIQQDWLRGYADFDFTCRAVAGVGRRIRGPNHLAGLIPWMQREYDLLYQDFRRLWAELEVDLAIAC